VAEQLPPPGWYRAQSDPPGTERYWDGQAWTSETRQITPPPAAATPVASTGEHAAGQHVAGQFGTRVGVGMRSHEIDYEVFGDDLQFVEIDLDPHETVIGEAGTMLMMADGIVFETKMGDGSEPDSGMMGKLLGAGKRMISGESLFVTHFTNHGTGKAKVSFAAPYPGKIVPVDLAATGNRLIAQKDAFLCAAFGTRIDIAFNRKLGAGLFGGEGFILQDLQGDGMCFLHAGGTVVTRDLRNETLRLDTGCLVALEPQLEYSIERAGNLKSMVFGGEGLFLATIRGTGRVWIQSLPFSRLISRIAASARTGRGNDEASPIGRLANVFENF
jgi:uncharacterized protein (TIGR00266 family)